MSFANKGVRSSFSAGNYQEPNMGILNSLIFILLAAILNSVYGWDYKDCAQPTAVGKLLNLEITPCGDDPDVCVLQRGTDVHFAVTFMSYMKAKKAKPVVHGYIGGVPLPFKVPESDGCKNSGLTCPLVKAQNYTYTSNLPILAIYPAIEVKVKWELQAETGDDLFCIEIPARLE